MDIRDINDFNNYYLDDDNWEFKAATPIEASDEEIKASVDTFIDGNYPGEFTQEEIIGICEAVRDRLASPYRDIDEGDLFTVVMNVTTEAKIRKERAAEVGYEYDDEMPQLIPYEDDEDDIIESCGSLKENVEPKWSVQYYEIGGKPNPKDRIITGYDAFWDAVDEAESSTEIWNIWPEPIEADLPRWTEEDGLIDDDIDESLEATVDQDLADNRQPAMDIGEKEMVKPVSYADMIKSRFGLKESKTTYVEPNGLEYKDGDYIFRVEMLEPGAHYRMSFLDSYGKVLEQKDENCMDDVLIEIYDFERMCYDKYCECEGCKFNPMSNDIVFDWQVKTFWSDN